MRLNLSRRLSRGLNLQAAAACVLLLIIPGLPGSSAGADSSEMPFESFQVIIDRNIFSPTGHPVQAEGPAYFEAPSHEVTEGDHISLVGALIYEGTAVAFFEGTSPDSSVLSRGGEVAGYRLVEIRSDAVTLEKDDERMELPVGSALREAGEGRWEVVTDSPGPDRLDSRPESEEGAEDGRDSSPFPATGANGDSSDDDVLRRLMERRRQELGQ